jgi:hypothetical protein
LILPGSPRCSHRSHPFGINAILDKAIRKFWDCFDNYFAELLEFGLGCSAAENDVFEIFELRGWVPGLGGWGKFFINKLS